MTKTPLTIDEKKAKLQAQREVWRRKLLALENKKRGANRKAETHLKAAVGGAVLAAIEAGKIKPPAALEVLKLAGPGIQKQGLARDKFNELVKTLTAKKQT